MTQPSEFMQKALHLAQKGDGRTLPNPMVGAVIVKSGRVIAQGWHKRCGADHAEIEALKKAKDNARGATLYVTLEPCSHWGRTPPCIDAIIQAGISKVVIGTLDPNPKTHGKSIGLLRKSGIKVEIGLLQDKIIPINKVFNKYMTKKIPFVVAKCAQTLDGKIATATGDSKWITSSEARFFARRKREEFDAIMVGINTVLQDDPGLNSSGKDKPLKKIVVDSSLQIPFNARLFKPQASDVIIATTSKASDQKIQQLRRKKVQVWVAPCKGRHKHVNLKWLMKELAKNELSYVLIEGGGRLIGRALKDGLVDGMMIYIAPKMIGDQNAVSSIAGLNIYNIHKALELKDMSMKQIGKDILIEGRV